MNIFIAVGSQLAFDRMLRIVDDWAASHPEAKVFAQSGPTAYKAQHLQSEAFVPRTTFEAKARASDVMIGHAGTGTIFLALELRTPVVIMPRRASLGEHRNDHQLATAEKFQHLQGVTVAWTDEDLRQVLENLENLEHPNDDFVPRETPQLLQAISDFINDPTRHARPSRVRKLLSSLRASP